MYRNQLNNQIINPRDCEAKVICAEYPAVYEQNRYTLHSAIAAIVIAATLWTLG